MQMTKTSEGHTDVSEDTKERFSADFDMLKSSFVVNARATTSLSG
jgi:hypothetical protein